MSGFVNRVEVKTIYTHFRHNFCANSGNSAERARWLVQNYFQVNQFSQFHCQLKKAAINLNTYFHFVASETTHLSWIMHLLAILLIFLFYKSWTQKTKKPLLLRLKSMERRNFRNNTWRNPASLISDHKQINFDKGL